MQSIGRIGRICRDMGGGEGSILENFQGAVATHLTTGSVSKAPFRSKRQTV